MVGFVHSRTLCSKRIVLGLQSVLCVHSVRWISLKWSTNPCLMSYVAQPSNITRNHSCTRWLPCLAFWLLYLPTLTQGFPHFAARLQSGVRWPFTRRTVITTCPKQLSRQETPNSVCVYQHLFPRFCVSCLICVIHFEWSDEHQQGGHEHFGRHCPRKTLPSCCDMTLGRQSHVPAKKINALKG